MEVVSSNAMKTTEAGGISKPSNTREVDFKRNDESSTAGQMSTDVDQENGLLRSGRHSPAPEERDGSPWAYVSIMLCYVQMKALLFIGLRDRFARLSFPVFKTKKLSDASTQTDSPQTGETRVGFTQTVTSECANASVQTVTLATKTVAAQTVTSATSAIAAQTDATQCHVVAVQTDATPCRAATVQTDAQTYSAAAVQTDSTAIYDTVAVPARFRAAYRGTVAGQTNDPYDFRLTYNTFSQTDWAACCKTVTAQTDPAAFCETVAAQTDPAAFCETVAAQTDPAAFCETVAAQTDSAAFCETVAAQTDSAAFCETVACQTDPPASACETVACQTDSTSPTCETIAVQTDSVPREDCGDNKKGSAAVAVAVRKTTDPATCRRAGVAAKRTVPYNAASKDSVGVQTDEPACATVLQTPKKNTSINAVNELSEKFGCIDSKATANSKKTVNLKAMLRKIELNGFKSLNYQELLFTHQKIIENSAILCNKYQSLIEIAVKHLPSWHRGSIKQRHDIVHIFATLDKVLDLKNKEIDRQKFNLTVEADRRIYAQQLCITKNQLLAEAETNYERLLAKNKTLMQSGCHSKSNRNSDIDRCIQQCSNSRFTYEEIMAGKFLKSPEIKDMIINDTIINDTINNDTINNETIINDTIINDTINAESNTDK